MLAIPKSPRQVKLEGSAPEADGESSGIELQSGEVKDREKVDNDVQGTDAANNDGGTDNVGGSRGAFWAPLHSLRSHRLG